VIDSKVEIYAQRPSHGGTSWKPTKTNMTSSYQGLPDNKKRGKETLKFYLVFMQKSLSFKLEVTELLSLEMSLFPPLPKIGLMRNCSSVMQK
jgi:hypothetical protein